MKIGITAASGQLGASIVRATLALLPKEDVVALARNQQKAQQLGVEVRPGDYGNPEQLEQSLQGIDVLLLVSGMDKPENRIGQHRNVMAAAKKAGVRKIVYTSVQGAEEGTAFSPVIQSNRQTELDLQRSGLEWVIGRNGIYIEPDIEYIEQYQQAGCIFNSAGDGKCGYTTRAELAYAYARMLIEDKHHGQIYNLNGEPITQTQLTHYMNLTFATELVYKPMAVEEYRLHCMQELGDFIGNVVGGIYQGIRAGKSNNPSDFEQAAGRPHQSWSAYFSELKIEP
ncbi:SDR family oxidoreductase [Ferrimonas lipolytica]|uniref:SDR family oxidoreductase n=2 Tax=Ferrimonas lipolytica TaxID=2724191 RepID=A0A6H1UL33_9GAMM|nr:SDR family oxidoreductase [Ferrimonas lipolytica]